MHPYRTFYFIRHGESESNAQQRCCGGTVDTPLTERGRQQAMQAEKHAHALDFASIYHSPLVRAADTARLINARRQLPLHQHSGLSEWNIGAWEGLPHHVFFEKLHQGLEPEQGETRAAFYDRVLLTFEEIWHKETQPFLIAAHGGVFFALASRLKAQTDLSHIENCHFIVFEKQFDIWTARSALAEDKA